MEYNKITSEPVSSLTGLNQDIRDLSGYLGCEKYFIIRQEMNKFYLFLNRSEYNTSWEDQIHNLFISLFHIENMENLIHSSEISEEIIYQSRIIKKIQLLKIAILNTIQEIKSNCRN